MNVAVRFPSDSKLLESDVFKDHILLHFRMLPMHHLKTTGRRGIFRRSPNIPRMHIEDIVEASGSGFIELHGERAVCVAECEPRDGFFGKNAWENPDVLQGA